MNKVAAKKVEKAVVDKKLPAKKGAKTNIIVAEAVAGASMLAGLAGLAVYLFGRGKPTKVQSMKLHVIKTVKKAKKEVNGKMKDAQKKMAAKIKKMRK